MSTVSTQAIYPIRKVVKQESWCPLWHVTFECGHTRNFETGADIRYHRCLTCPPVATETEALAGISEWLR